MQGLRYFFKNLIFLPAAVAGTAIIAAAVVVLGRFGGSSVRLQNLERMWAEIILKSSRLRIQADIPDLDPGQTYLFVANHQSLLDIPILLRVLRPWFPRFVAKKSLFTIPLFGPGMARTGHVGVDRENSRQGMRDMQEAVRRLHNGESLLIFPEGTRGPADGGLQDFHIGALVIALKAKMPIVPVLIDGSGRVMPRGTMTLHPGTVRVRGLAPRELPEQATMKDRNELKNALWAEMDTTLREMNTWTLKSD